MEPACWLSGYLTHHSCRLPIGSQESTAVRVFIIANSQCYDINDLMYRLAIGDKPLVKY